MTQMQHLGRVARLPRALDLFCGQGGAARGYACAGFDVTGVDIVPQRRYPYRFILGDAATHPQGGYAFRHASPPCEDHSVTMAFGLADRGTGWLLQHTIDRFRATTEPWVIENVDSAATRALMPGSLMLCGSMFGLGAHDSSGQYRVLRRHRLFLSNVPIAAPGSCTCAGRLAGGVYGHGEQSGRRGYGFAAAPAREAMGMPWASRDGVAEAIPPAYTEHIGRQIMTYLR